MKPATYYHRLYKHCKVARHAISRYRRLGHLCYHIQTPTGTILLLRKVTTR